MYKATLVSKEYTNTRINWRSVSKYVDMDTGEELTIEEVKEKYTIIKKTKKSHVYKTTGTTTITNECRRSNQIRIW